MSRAQQRGRIFTFYSYKGGAGRSMLLANVAWQLALNGQRVLAIDWDLEAPGLHRYFAPFLQDPELAFSDGLLEFVGNFRQKAMTPPVDPEDSEDDWYRRNADIADYAVALDWEYPAGGCLHFVPAGRQDEGYSELVNGFDWKHFYTSLGGSRFLQAAADLMRRDYDYVLIDSRTGVSDTSGLCTVVLPDSLVVCFTLNYQSINGAASVADFAYERRVVQPLSAAALPGVEQTTAFNIFPIPTRLEDAQQRKLERRREYARSQRFSRYPLSLYRGQREDYWSSVGVRYSTFYAYEEVLAAFGEKERDENSLMATVQRITAYLTDGKVDGTVALPLPRRDAILRAFEGDVGLATSLPPPSSPDALIGSLRPDERAAAKRALLRMVRVFGAPPRHDLQVGSVLASDLDPASRQVMAILGRSGLVVESRDGSLLSLSADTTLGDFSQLRAWIATDLDFLVWRRELAIQARVWQQAAGGSIDGAGPLLAGPALGIALAWVGRRGLELSPGEQRYIAASRDAAIQAARDAAQSAAQSTLQSRTDLRAQAGATAPAAPAAGSAGASGMPDSAMMRARSLLRGRKTSIEEVLRLARALKNEQQFTYARRLLAQLVNDPDLEKDRTQRLHALQQCALCTYKDTDLPADERLDRALDLLRRADDLESTREHETLGLAGAIHKRKWEIDGQIGHLERALHFYRRGYEAGVTDDQGYCGINAAFVIDLIAGQLLQAEADGSSRSAIEARRLEAMQIREHIVADVAPLMLAPGTTWLAQAWWFYATIAEAMFGLGNYDEALEWLERGRAAVPSIPAWELQSTLQQLARLALLHQPRASAAAMQDSQAWQVLLQFFGGEATAVRSAFVGKTGLALSGGGFRAALYHIGVLAKLAELDVLRHVEVLSCVSGGSIVGAFYYLELRHLLETKADTEITRQDYIDIVKRIEAEFVKGVQTNIRMRVLAGLGTNLRMLFDPRYSRTRRVAELFDRFIYARVSDGHGEGRRPLRGTIVQPLGEPAGFLPRRDNWRRRAKVPTLILNATSLNTGHVWQFTSTWMGESPARLAAGIDTVERLRRMYHWEAPEPYRDVSLAEAVAASACVPGLFEPLEFEGLYPARTVRLVDGGVCDNQGTAGLLDQDCTVMLVSDGSGQAGAQLAPSGGLLGVPLRANTILQARVRDSQYQELRARKRASLLRGLLFVHLRDDLDSDPVDWTECPDPFDASTDARPASRRGILTAYGIDRRVQSLLSALRTDLDAFADLESDALMTSGYRMTEHQFRTSPDLAAVPTDEASESWAFLAIERALATGTSTESQVRHFLAVGQLNVFKLWHLSLPMRIVGRSLLVATLIAAGWLWTLEPIQLLGPVSHRQILGSGALLVAAGLATKLGFGRVAGAVFWREKLYRIATGLSMSVVGWLLARLHLSCFNGLYLKLGSTQRYLRAMSSRP